MTWVHYRRCLSQQRNSSEFIMKQDFALMFQAYRTYFQYCWFQWLLTNEAAVMTTDCTYTTAFIFKWSLSPTKTLYPILFLLKCATCLMYLTLLDYNTQTIFNYKWRSWSSSLYNFLPLPVTSCTDKISFSAPYFQTISSFTSVHLIRTVTFFSPYSFFACNVQ